MSTAIIQNAYQTHTPIDSVYAVSSDSNISADANIEQIIRQICSLIKMYARREKDVLHLLEEAQRYNWDASVQNHISEMRCWSSKVSRIAGVAIAVISAVPQISPEFIQWGLRKLTSLGLSENALTRFEDLAMVAKTSSKVANFVKTAHDHLDNLNATRLRANEVQNQSLGELFRDSYQKHSTASEQEKRTIEELLRGLEDILKSKQQTQKAMLR